jgi:hypothetical protein
MAAWMAMAQNVILHGEVASHLDMLDVRRNRCGRHGRLRLDCLLARTALTSQCPVLCVPR